MTVAVSLSGNTGARPLPDTSLIRLLRGMLRPYRFAALAAVALGSVASLAEGLRLGLLVPLLQSMAPAAAGSGGSSWVVDFLGSVFEGVPAARR